MKYVLTANEMKETDRRTMERFGMPPAVLMERAALALAAEAQRRLEAFHAPKAGASEEADESFRTCGFGDSANVADRSAARTLVVCGSGNNGGDGFAAARILLLRGFPADVWFVGDPERMTPQCRSQRDIFLAYGGTVCDVCPEGEYCVIIDALFGVGLSREVAGTYAEALRAVNRMGGYKLAADIPSGVSADDGRILGEAFRADLTVTFGFYKRGLLLYPGKGYAGRIRLDDVGLTEHALGDTANLARMPEPDDIARNLPERTASGHKGMCGRVLVIAGSEAMCGAAYLSAGAALTCGAGLVKIYTHQSNRQALCSLLPEALISCYSAYDPEQLLRELSWADTVVIGPGLSKSALAAELVQGTLSRCEKPCIVDADALNILAKHPEFAGRCTCKRILTPHLAEMGRLLKKTAEEVAQARFLAAEQETKEFADVCVVKDAVTVTGVRGEGPVLNPSGNSALSKGGSGDVLTGVIAALLAQGCEPGTAAWLGVYLHGLAAERESRKKGYYSVMASDLFDALSELFKAYGSERTV